MKYQQTAKEIYNAVGGSENIQTVTHCVTRLRLILKNQDQVNDEEMKAITGVMGVMKKAGQYQVILGNDVANYYRAFTKLGNFSSEPVESMEKKNLFENLVDVISGCMSPLIPALLGGGMIKVLLIVLPLIGALSESSSTYAVLSFFGDAPFYFMPVMLAFTASKIWCDTDAGSCCRGNHATSKLCGDGYSGRSSKYLRLADHISELWFVGHSDFNHGLVDEIH